MTNWRYRAQFQGIGASFCEGMFPLGIDFTEEPWADLRMDFRRRKLYLTLGITGIGMLLAVIWHGWQGWGLGRTYPYNTFLFIPAARFSDFAVSFLGSEQPSPYDNQLSTYFPFAYVVLRCFALLSLVHATVLFLYLTFLGLGVALLIALRPLLSTRKELLICAGGLLAFSYPVLTSLDRANIELMMALLVSIALLYFRQRRWISGLAVLLPAICLKAYPILLLALFLRPRHLGKIVIVAVAFPIVSLCSLASFDHSIATNWQLWHDNFRIYADAYIIHNNGFAGSASAWNMLKATVISGYCLSISISHAKSIPFMVLLNFVYHIYVILAVGSALTVTSYVILIEREFFRRVVLLLLLVTMAIPSGPDYKLLYANVALIVFILLPKERPHDLLVTGLLALVMVPKREILLPLLGASDSQFNDISIAIFLNPLCMLAIIVLVMRDGFRSEIKIPIRQRLFGLINPIRHLIMPRTREHR